MRVRISAGRRDIVLMRGEALFHVAHDTSRPFFVTAAATLVRAVGTAFSVRIREDNSVDVLVTEGRVAVGRPRSDTAGEPQLTPPATAVAAGEAAAVSRGSLRSRHLSAEEMARKLAWTDPAGPRLSFWGETLSEAVGEFNRYNVRHLSIADPQIQQIRFGGNFKASDLDGFVETLKSFHVIAAESGRSDRSATDCRPAGRHRRYNRAIRRIGRGLVQSRRANALGTDKRVRSSLGRHGTRPFEGFEWTLDGTDGMSVSALSNTTPRNCCTASGRAARRGCDRRSPPR